MTNERIVHLVDNLLAANDLSKPSLIYTTTEDLICEAVVQCTLILLEQNTMLEIEAPVAVCGDIHGQYPDLLRIFQRCGYPPSRSYLFLGDYVDRGRQQLEVITLLISYKILYPECFFILRGNHEDQRINEMYGFYEECKRRYSVRLYNFFQVLFDSLPLCSLISGRILAMHGGLSPELRSWSQVNALRRPLDPEDYPLAMDILWSDPDQHTRGWAKNDIRGVSYMFGPDVVKKFCREMNIDLIVRAHQMVQDGYEFFADRHLVTIFSAPRYCGEDDNNGAVMIVRENLECSFEILKAVDNKTRVRTTSKRRRRSKKAKKGRSRSN
ncbi:Serine/threonine-protein phosphatase PP1 isozyme 7 [Parelaphostrongylus tenuis]|uniref:Serine/threonine-protein phosphatase n=1 Tax=Parelaphostrongylus tenuis TaxID=148309 RepID=A0AAD5LVV6_PARTN|nr:Serine/threonine-protein phosphatase PP1 isozyme 7 [Parelaphostrongylus tenuis]